MNHMSNIHPSIKLPKCTFQPLHRLLIGLIFGVLTYTYASASHNVTGVVKDMRTGEGIAAARIAVHNEHVSATTDEQGNFVLQTVHNTPMLRVSAYGYTTREIPLQGRTSLHIELLPEGFQPLLNALNTMNAPTAKIPLHSTALSSDDAVSQLFHGTVRGIARSGNIGMGSSLFIRGLHSLHRNAQPLFVVDGVIRDNLYDGNSIHAGFFSNPLTNIENNDIENITVLKDGTSLYGSKGANGVILITTRQANDMVTRINLNMSTGITTMPKTIPVMSASDYRIYLSEMYGSAGLTSAEVLQLPFMNDDPKRSTYKTYHNNTDWNDYIYQYGTQNNYAINVTGGDEKALYYFALGFTDIKGVVKNNDFQRYNMRLNAQIKLADKISSDVHIGFSRIDRNLIDDGVAAYTSPTWIALTKSPFLNPYNHTFLGDLTSEYAVADMFAKGNPAAIIHYSINTVKQNSFNIGIKPTLQLTPELTLTQHFDYYLNKTNEDYYRPYLYTAPIFIEGIGNSYNARMSQVMRSRVIFSDTRIHFHKKFGANHLLNAFAGSRVILNHYESDYAEGHNSLSNSSINLRGSFKNLVTDGINQETRSVSHYINADYHFKQRYLLNAIVSMDASSRFGSQTQGSIRLLGQSWALFPSINGAWLISSEPFMHRLQQVSLLKLNAGYSVSGNDDIPMYQTKAYFGSEKLMGVASGLVLKQLAYPSIQWETTQRANFGLEVGLLNDRLHWTIDFYHATTDHLLVMKDLPEVVGLGKYWTNEGQLTNTGLETSLRARILSYKNLQWEATVSVGRYRNRITQLPLGAFTTQVFDGEVITQVGQPAGVFYGYKALGVITDEQHSALVGLSMKNESGVLVPFGPGDVIFEDISSPTGVKDGIIDSYDRQIIGDPNPDWYGSLHQQWKYRQWTLSALFTFSVGNDIYNYRRQQLESQSDFSNQSLAVLSRWRTEGQQTTQPRSMMGDPKGNARFSNRWMEDGSYLKLKTLALSYQLPLQLTFIQEINVWLSAENLFTVSQYLGPDPELSASNRVLYQGVDAGLLPLSKTFNLGFRFNL